MFGLGAPELVVIAVVALLLFGPKRLPELAKGMGKGLRDFKKALEGKGEAEETKPPIDVSKKSSATEDES